jgi:hypothetical protein
MPFKTGSWGIQAKMREKTLKRISYKKRYYCENRERCLAYRRVFEKVNPRTDYYLKVAKTPKGIARYMLRSAVREGHIIKPKICSSCGKEKLLHGHHKDYSKPLEVIWVCAMCHAEIHRRIKNG